MPHSLHEPFRSVHHLIPALGVTNRPYSDAAIPWTDLRILGLILAVAGLWSPNLDACIAGCTYKP